MRGDERRANVDTRAGMIEGKGSVLRQPGLREVDAGEHPEAIHERLTRGRVDLPQRLAQQAVDAQPGVQRAAVECEEVDVRRIAPQRTTQHLVEEAEVRLGLRLVEREGGARSCTRGLARVAVPDDPLGHADRTNRQPHERLDGVEVLAVGRVDDGDEEGAALELECGAAMAREEVAGPAALERGIALGGGDERDADDGGRLFRPDVGTHPPGLDEPPAERHALLRGGRPGFGGAFVRELTRGDQPLDDAFGRAHSVSTSERMGR